jgi:uncharacterized protein (UPF0276 family)
MSDAPAKLGVGLSYLPSKPELVAALVPAVDYVELGPELFVTEADHGATVFDQVAAGQALDTIGALPVVVHGLELSIGSAHGWNEPALNFLDRFLELRDVPWHSEHLNFLSATASDGSIVQLGLPMPLPFTAECAALVAERADAIIGRYTRPFLLENSANYLPDLPRDPGWDEATFLTELTAASGCGLLLDLLNLWTNCINHRLDPVDLIDRIPLDRVIEIHVAGGEERDGLLLDSHSAEVPEPVWRLLADVLSRAPNVAGVTVEVLDQYVGRLGEAGVRTQLGRARAAWEEVR